MKACIQFIVFFLISSAQGQIEPGFVEIQTVNKNILVDMRYSTDWNFIGQPIVGYQANKCLLTKQAALALSDVQVLLETKGLSLLVFDCYRPQRSVSEFVNWTKDSLNQKMKNIFYPNEPKGSLINRGYISARSSHSRGSTVDLTLAYKLHSRPIGKEELVDCRKTEGIESSGQLNMGSSFDCFDKLSNTANSEVSAESKKIEKF